LSSDRANDRGDAPSLRLRRGSELGISGPALVDLMRAVLEKGRWFRFCAKGGSMSPFIRDGDVITVAPLQPVRSAVTSGLSPGLGPGARSCGIGQVVAFINPVNRRLVVHRTIGRRQSRFLIQGDNLSEACADVVGPEDILGRVVRIERGRRRVWLGLGLERYAIAILSRVRLLLPIRLRVGALTRFLRSGSHQNAR